MSSTLTDLTAATTWSGTDLFYALVGGNSRKIAASSLLVCEAANVLADQNGANAQTFRLYRTFTDSSNYERLALQSGSGYMEIAAETSGTGNDHIGIRLTPAGIQGVNISSVSNDPTVPALLVTNTYSGAMSSGENANPIINFLATNLPAGSFTAIKFGKELATGNSVILSFSYVGNNNNSNAFEISFYSGLTVLSALKTGQVSVTGLLAYNASQGVGYGVGAGASGTQLTSKSTTVTALQGVMCGQITTHNAALAASASVQFTCVSNAVKNTDIIIVNHQSGGTLGAYRVDAVNIQSLTSFNIMITNISGGSLSEALVLNIAIIRSVIT